MKKILTLIGLTLFTHPASASFISYFKDEDGHTKWQYVANFSSSVLILLLSGTAITLFFSHRRAIRANRELEAIKSVLEDRVKERTATLDESNRLLTESNERLAGEIESHKATGLQLLTSEAYLNNILESMPSMLIGVNEDLEVTHWNQSAESITGVSRDQAVGMNLWEAYPVITISKEQLQEVLESNTPKTVKHSQYGQYYFDITLFPLQDHSEPGLVINVDNVTQRTLAENMLIQQDKMSSMGELASIVASDIDIPVRAIQNDIDIVQQKVDRLIDGEEVNTQDKALIRQALIDAKEKGEQTGAILNNLLAFSKIDGEQKQLASITDIIDHALDVAATTFADIGRLSFREITITRKYEDNLPLVNCISAELQQVFLSLFRHACYALDLDSENTNDPKISLEVMECYDDIWIKVQHNGRGLSSEEQRYIFEPFFNPKAGGPIQDIENRLSFPYFIITEHHRGQMAVTSDINVGTTFHIQLRR